MSSDSYWHCGGGRAQTTCLRPGVDHERSVLCVRPMWGGKDSLRAAVWEVLKLEPEGLTPEDIAQRVTDGSFKLAGSSSTSEARLYRCAPSRHPSSYILAR